MESIWTKDCSLPRYPQLIGEQSADVAVVGGGITGLLTAYFLQKQGLHPIVLEANRICTGQTAGTTAKITAAQGLCYTQFEKTWGQDIAARYARIMQEAIEDYARVIDYEGIDCDFTRCAHLLYSTSDQNSIQKEVEAAARAGLDARFTTDTELPFPVAGAVRVEQQARFHPLRFVGGILSNLTVYENSRVQEVSEGRLLTNAGAVNARHIIFATHFPFVNAPGYYFLRMHQERSYSLALENTPQLTELYWSADLDGYSLRPAGKYLLLVGAGHRTGENRAGQPYEQLRETAARWWSDARPIAQWSAQDCIPMDGLPYIGQYSADTPNWYTATGFAKWGMTGAMAAATRLCALICGHNAGETELFSPLRFSLSKSARQMVSDGLEAVRALTRPLIEPSRAILEELPLGHGGIIEYEGQKAAVSKDAEGNTTIHSCRCSHLGCQVEWNPAERTWECPCHGSRFAEDGSVLDGPAQEGLDTP